MTGKKTGFTNHPLAKNVMKAFPIIKWIIVMIGLAIFGYMTMWLRAELYTRNEGEELESKAYMKEDAVKLEVKVEAIEEDVAELEKHMYGFSIEQKQTNKSLDELKDILKDHFRNVRDTQ